MITSLCLESPRWDDPTEATCFGALHLFPDLLDLGSIHAVVSQRTLFEKLLAVFPISQVVDNLMQTSLDFWPVTVPDRFDEEVAESLLTEELA